MTKPPQGLFKSDTWKLLFKLFKDHACHHVNLMVISIVCMILVALTTAFLAQQMQPVIDDVFFKKNVERLTVVAFTVFMIFLVKGISTYGQSVATGYVGQSIVQSLQKTLFASLIHKDLSFFHKTQVGQIISRFVRDIPVLDNVITNTLTSMIKDTLTLIFLVGLMFYQDWMLASIAFFTFPIAILPVSKIGKRMRKAASFIQVGWGGLTTLLTQAFQGIRLVKSYGLEDHEIKRSFETIDSVFNMTVKGIRIKSIVHPIMEMFGGIAIVVVIVYGGMRVINDVQSAGSFFSFVTALIMAYEPMKNLAKLNTNLQESLAAVTRVYEVMEMPNIIVDKQGAKPFQLMQAAIEFQGVHFQYEEEKKVLKGINLLIKPGQKIALVGPSGAGKSTIMNMIPRFYDPNQGAVFIDGQNIREVTLSSLRDHIALVSQDVILFDDTVRANISYGRLNATDAEIKQAATKAAAHEFIMELPQGYDTFVGEQGVKLSGGQRQRLSIARAMLRNAPILLLDEATSNLDSESEKHIQEALRILMQGRTTISIAHRLSTVIDADLICVVEDGRISATGKHADLIKTSKTYARLCKVQFSGAHTV